MTKTPQGHKSTTIRFGRPVVFMRKCECGWTHTGYGSAEWAREQWEAHIAAVQRRNDIPAPGELLSMYGLDHKSDQPSGAI